MACHARELAELLCDHAAREYLPVVTEELARLSSAGRGYDFIPHRVQFCARVHLVRAKAHLELSLCHVVGNEVRLAQGARQLWCADGSYRLH